MIWKVTVAGLSGVRRPPVRRRMATEAALYDQLSGGSLRSKLPSVAFQNLPLALFLEYSDLGFPAWTGGRRGIQSNGDIISSLGVTIMQAYSEQK